jgi:hypothetical protein
MIYDSNIKIQYSGIHNRFDGVTYGLRPKVPITSGPGTLWGPEEAKLEGQGNYHPG